MHAIHTFQLRGLIILTCLLTITSCQSNKSNIEKNIDKIKLDSLKNEKDTTIIDLPPPIGALEQKIIDAGLIDVQSVDKSILVELKYASTDNFMDTNVYGSFKKAYLQPEVAKSLVKAQQFLQSIDSSLTLLIYDAVRPRSVQQFMWDYLDLPIAQKVKFVSNPKNGSIHNYGSAVDLTIAKRNGEALDMGAKYDEIDKIAYPRLENQYLSKGLLTQAQIDNRKLLRKVMKHGEFTGIGTEWWHFNRYPRWKAKQLYDIIE